MKDNDKQGGNMLTLGMFGSLAAATLGGFPLLQVLREEAMKKDASPPEQILRHWYAFAYTFTFPGMIFFGSFLLKSNGWQKVGILLIAAIFAFVDFFFRPLGGLPDIWTGAMSFGLRGTAIGISACLTLLAIVKSHSASQALHYISISAFGMAAWFTCGLGSIGAWVSHPEYGTFEKESKQLMAFIQCFFIVGFVCAALAHLKSPQVHQSLKKEE